MLRLVEYIVRTVENTCIVEMAFDRKSYIKALTGLREQLVQNWCLIRYCTVVDSHDALKHHWKKELATHIFNLSNMVLKLDKTRASEEVLLKKSEYNKEFAVERCIAPKFIEENIEIDDNKMFDNVVADCAEYGIYELIEYISDNKKSSREIINYIDKI